MTPPVREPGDGDLRLRLPRPQPADFRHAFYNSKDIPTPSLFVISVYTLLRFLDEGAGSLKGNPPWGPNDPQTFRRRREDRADTLDLAWH